MGIGDSNFSSSPQLIETISGRVVGIAASAFHSLALLESGKVYGWGNDLYGQLGYGTTSDKNRPKLIKNIPGKVVSIAAGAYHSLALLDSGKVYSWGWNSNGQLGDGTTTDRRLPKLIETLSGKVASITAGYYHTLALLENGRVLGWGRDGEGQLGDRTLINRNTPQFIKPFPNKVISIAAGTYYSLALLENGKVCGWGYNIDGELGDSTKQNRNIPQLIEALPGKVVSIAAGEQHSIALIENGKVYGWGIMRGDSWEVVNL